MTTKPVDHTATSAIIKNVQQSSFNSSFIAGLSAGMASTIAGYPPDTIKVRLQTQDLSKPLRYTGAINCCTKMISEEGLASLFRGMSTPLLTRGFVNAITFSSYTFASSMLHKQPGNNSLGITFLAGGIAGASAAFIATPSELIKVQLQASYTPGDGPLVRCREVFRAMGVRGLFAGMVPTMTRDFVCIGTFMATTRLFSQALSPYISSPQIVSLLGGATAGICGWAVCYPLDVWKSNIQDFSKHSTGQVTSLKHQGFFSFCASRLKSVGIRGLYSGLAPTLFRAVPVNASKFFMFDTVMKILQR